MKNTHVLVELKARVEDLEPIRRRLRELNAKYVGTFQQTDTYFEVPRGRLKLRETTGHPQAQLIYYEREGSKEPKKSEVFILKIDQKARFKAAVEKFLKVKAIVSKNREIYEHTGTRIHLDAVEKLGKFVEFERSTARNEGQMRKDKQVLEGLLEVLQIPRSSLERLSYGELIREKQPRQG